MNADIHIIGVGACTPIGLDAPSSAAATRAGISRVADHPFIVDRAGEPVRCGRVPTIDCALFGPQRLVALAVAVINEATLAACDNVAPPSLQVFLALPSPRPGFGAAEIQLVVRGVEDAKIPAVPRIEVEAVVGGHAAGILALELASARIAQRGAELCVVAGVDSYVEAAALDWLEADRSLMRDGVRGGFPPGEGAAAIVVAGSQWAARFRRAPLGRVRGVATGHESRSRDSVEGILGEGLTDVVRRAAQGLRLPDERVEDIYSDINGERHRSDEWGFVTLRAWQMFRDGTAYITNVGHWGDLGAASAVANFVLAVQAWRRRYASGEQALICGSSSDGLRGAAVLERQGI
jgi:3-oxoacyl-[acyl-carrier-protein] synthase I